MAGLLYGAYFLQQAAADDRPHIFGFNTARTTANDTLVEVWNAATSAGIKAAIDLNGKYYSAAWTAGDVPYAVAGGVTGVKRLDSLAIGAANTVMTSSGTAPQWSTSLTLAGSLTAGTGLTVTTGGATITAGGLVVSASGITVTGNSTITGTLGGVTTLTATTLAGTLSTAAQPNITSLGTLTSLTVSGAVNMGALTATTGTFSGAVGGVTTLTATTLAGTLSTAAQPNITSLGTLTSILTSGNAQFGTGGVTPTVGTRVDIVGGTAQVTLSDVTTNLTNKHAILTQRHYTNAEEQFVHIYGSSVAASTTLRLGGGHGSFNAITIFNVFAAANTTTLTGTKILEGTTAGWNFQSLAVSMGALTATTGTFSGAVGGVTTLTATTLAGTLSTAAQPNVTSLGTLTALTVSGAVSMGALTISTASGTRNLKVRTADSGASLTIFQNVTTGTGDTQGMVYGIDADEAGYLFNYSNTPIFIGTNATLRWTVSAVGNLTASGAMAITTTGAVSVGALTATTVTASGLISANLGLTVASGKTLTLTGATITGAPTWSSAQAITLSTAAQPNVTSLGTLTALQVDNLNINGNTISATTGAINITPVAGSAIVLDGTISVDAGVVTGATSITSTALVGALTGNASTATALQTARTINGVSFDGTANITVTAAAGTLTGTTLAATVTASSLTSVGTLTSLTVSGAVSMGALTATTGTFSGAVGGVTTLTATTLLIGSTSPRIYATTDTVFLSITGGSAYDSGARLTLYGGTHATAAGDIYFLSLSSTGVLAYDRSTNIWYFGAYTGTIAVNMGALTATTVTASGLLQVTLTTQQLALRYDVNNHLAVTVGSTGIVTYNATGAGAKHVFSDLVEVDGDFDHDGTNFGALGAAPAPQRAHQADATDLASAITAVNYALATLETFGYHAAA